VRANHLVLSLGVLGSVTRAFVLNFQPFAANLKSVHGGNCRFCTPRVIIGNKTEAFALRCFLVDENFGRDDVPERRKERSLLTR